MKANETLLAERFALLLGPAEYVGFLDALEEVLDSEVMVRDSGDIWGAFCWTDSPQGHDFWHRYGNIQDGKQ